MVTTLLERVALYPATVQFPVTDVVQALIWSRMLDATVLGLVLPAYVWAMICCPPTVTPVTGTSWLPPMVMVAVG